MYEFDYFLEVHKKEVYREVKAKEPSKVENRQKKKRLDNWLSKRFSLLLVILA